MVRSVRVEVDPKESRKEVVSLKDGLLKIHE